jgi:putative SOS response-associated peptidase YedK
MPLILTDDEAKQWVFDQDVKNLIKPCKEEILKAHTVSKMVSNSRAERNVEEVQELFLYPELGELTK